MVLIFTECGIKKVLFLDLPELYKPCVSQEWEGRLTWNERDVNR